MTTVADVDRDIPHKICPCCEKIFHKLINCSQKNWENQIHCSSMCKGWNYSSDTKLKFIFSRTITTESGCMEWQLFKGKEGYGQVKVLKKMHLVHRYVWELINGEIPKNKKICHTCDNPPCINPKHLFEGTQLDNQQDMVRKGRQAKGLKVYGAKLSEQDKCSIIQRVKNGDRQIDIANTFFVSRYTIYSISKSI